MSVYVELVIFNNFAVDALLVALTLAFRKRRIKKFRFFVAVSFASAIATLYPLANESWQIAIKVLLCPLVTLIFDVYDKSSTKAWLVDYAKSLVLFLLFTYFVGGVVYALSALFGVEISSYATLGITALAIAIATLVVHYLVRTRSIRQKRTCKAYVAYENKMVEFDCFCDSGNTLTDDFSGAPIVILSLEAERKIVDDSTCKIEGFVSVNTISSECSMPILRLGGVCVDGREYLAYGALSRKHFDGFDVILQNTMF